MEIKTIKTRHIYKHLIRGRLKNHHPKLISINFWSRRGFSLGKVYMLPSKTTTESTEQQEFFNIKS